MKKTTATSTSTRPIWKATLILLSIVLIAEIALSFFFDRISGTVETVLIVVFCVTAFLAALSFFIGTVEIDKEQKETKKWQDFCAASDGRLQKCNEEIVELRKELSGLEGESNKLRGLLDQSESNNRTTSEYLYTEYARASSAESNLAKAKEKIMELQDEIAESSKIAQFYTEFLENSKSSLKVIPYMAGIISDLETHKYEILATRLEWGSDKSRLRKVASIREIKKDAQEKIMAAKQAEYQLKYLIEMFPSIEDLLDLEFSALPDTNLEDLADRDAAKDYLSKEEWNRLSDRERNQLALDRYIASHKKSKWQIGRDYEEFIAYRYRKEGYKVDHFGAYMGLEDMGRDIIAIKGRSVHIVQCKYWSLSKTIHEKHINQLFGTAISYAIENEIPSQNVKAVFVTNTTLSKTAHKFAERLKVSVCEQLEMSEFPRIKCNIGREGERIYHLPFDQQYDSAKIDKPGEFYATTVKEAEQAGFRRAYKWYGNQ